MLIKGHFVFVCWYLLWSTYRPYLKYLALSVLEIGLVPNLKWVM